MYAITKSVCCSYSTLQLCALLGNLTSCDTTIIIRGRIDQSMRERAVIVRVVNDPIPIPPCSIVANDLYIPLLLGVNSVKKYTCKINEWHYAKDNGKYETGFNVAMSLNSGYVDPKENSAHYHKEK